MVLFGNYLKNTYKFIGVSVHYSYSGKSVGHMKRVRVWIEGFNAGK